MKLKWLAAWRAAPGRWHGLAGVLASAVLLGIYARGGHAWLLAPIVLVPWLLALEGRRTTAAALASAWGMSVAFMAAVFAWFGAAIGAYIGIGAGPATLVLLLLAPLLQGQLLAFALVRHWVGRRHGPGLRALAGASAWVACEWLVPKLLGDTLGHGLFPSATLRQAADLGGAAGLSFLLILINEALALAVLRWREGPARRALRPAMLAAAVMAAMAAYGLVRLATLPAPPAGDAPTLRVAMVQANITHYERLRAEIGAYGVVRRVLDTHYALSSSAIRDHGADALLWSETVYPTTFGHAKSEDGAALDREIQSFVDTAGVPLVFGTYDIDAAGEYNAAAFVEPGRGLLGYYRKTHPFPLTEHVPDGLDGPLLRRLLPWTGGWQPGDGARVLPLRTRDGRQVEVVPLICLDDVRTGLAIDGARLGAQAIIGLSNDSWFTDHPHGARLHLAVAAFRSIETRLPQLRVTTNGLSAVIDDTGEVLASTAMGDAAVLTGALVARDPPPTLMVRWGDWVGRAGLLFVLALAVRALVAGWGRRVARARDAEGDAAGANAAYSAEVALLSPAWRAAAGLLRACAGAGLLWLALDMLVRRGAQVQSLSQIGAFAAMVVAPALSAWAIQRAFAARARIEAGLLSFDQRHRRIEIPVGEIVALHAWRLPLPGSGVDLTLASGRRWAEGIALADARALQQALVAAGSPVRMAGGASARMAAFAQMRAAVRRHWFDHAPVKFAVFALLPAAVAFRLHQHVAYGGTFGEYYIYGAKAWLLGLLIWWASWSMGLMLFAAALRIAIEIGSVFALLLRPSAAIDIRHALEWLARLVFYVGVPVWLLQRVMSG